MIFCRDDFINFKVFDYITSVFVRKCVVMGNSVENVAHYIEKKTGPIQYKDDVLPVLEILSWK